MNRYSISYEKYDRDGGEIRTDTFMVPNDKAALLVAHPGMGRGCGKFNPEDFDEEEKELIKNMSTEDLCTNIHECNGDGQDMLFNLRNETTGTTIFDGGFGMDGITVCEEWNEEIFEGFLD